MCWHAWASAAAAADKLVTWFTGWEWPWQAVGHGSRMAQFGTDVMGKRGLLHFVPLCYFLAVPGSPWAGPYDPVGAPYGRRGHGRLRRPTHAYPRHGKGVKSYI